MSPPTRAAALFLGIAVPACAPSHGPAGPEPAHPPAPAPTAAAAPASTAPAAPVAPAAPAAPAASAARPEPKTVQSYVRVAAPRVVLAHVRVIDGAGHAPLDDRNVIVEHGKITAIGAGADVTATADTTVLDLHGHSVLPGLVGMHDHLYYIARPNFDDQWISEPPLVSPQLTFSAPRL